MRPHRLLRGRGSDRTGWGSNPDGAHGCFNKWKMVGEVLIPGVLNTGDIEKTDGCQQAAALADKI